MASTISAGTSAGTAIAISGDTSGALQLQTNGTTTAVTIDTSQNVGIGTSSPTVKLQVIGTTISSNFYTGTGTASAGTFGADSAGTGASIIMYGSTGANPGAMILSAGSSERMRIDSSGTVLVGKTTGALTSNGWALYPNLSSNYAFDMGGTTNECFNYNNTGTGTYDVAFRYQGTVKGYIRVNSTNTTYSTTSDYRLKENIAPMVGALEKVVQLKPVTYTWKADGSDGQGFIAHELQAVIPDAVVGEKDAVETYTDEEGNEQTRIKAQGIDTSFLVATLTAAIQEQQTIIIQLQADVAALKGVK